MNLWQIGVLFSQEYGHFEKVEVVKGGLNNFFEFELHKDNSFTGFDSTYFTYHGEKLLIIREYNNGQKKRSTAYYDNGTKFREVMFTNGRKDCTESFWFKNGNIKSIDLYQNGKLVLPTLEWYETGELAIIVNQYPKVHGGWIKEFYKNGSLKNEYIDIDSVPDAFIIKDYYENGQLFIFEVNNCGKQRYFAFYSNGIKGVDGFIYNMRMFEVGYWREWFENGQLKQERFFHDNIPNQKEGTWSWWDEEGNLIKQEFYDNGELLETKDYSIDNKIIIKD